MDKMEVLRILSVILLISILFTPADSKIWIYILILAVVFGISWVRE